MHNIYLLQKFVLDHAVMLATKSGMRSLVVGNLQSETKDSPFESSCYLCAEVSCLQYDSLMVAKENPDRKKNSTPDVSIND